MATSVKKGDKVQCSAQRDWNGTHLASFVRKNTYTVMQVGGKNLSKNRIVIGKGGVVTAAVHIKYLTVIKPRKNKVVGIVAYKPKTVVKEISPYLINDDKISLLPPSHDAINKIISAMFRHHIDTNVDTADGKTVTVPKNDNKIDSELDKLYEASLIDNDYNQWEDSDLKQRFSEQELAEMVVASTIDDAYNEEEDSDYKERFDEATLAAIKEAGLIDDAYNEEDDSDYKTRFTKKDILDIRKATINNKYDAKSWSWLYKNTKENQKIVKDLLEVDTASDDYNLTEYVNGKEQIGNNNKPLPPITETTIEKIMTNDPSIVKNHFNFPPVVSKTKKKINGKDKTVYTYNYKTQDFREHYNENDAIVKRAAATLKLVEQSNNTNLKSRSKIIEYQTKYYNRFKINMANNQLSKTFAHIFFVRPDCNIFAAGKGGSKTNPVLSKNLKTESEFYYALKHNPQILRQLTQRDSGYNNQFMMLLSNAAKSFELSDEYVVSDTYGQSLTGYKVAYGKDNVESKTAGKFSINYIDDRDLNIYQTHKLWIDYISNVYRGKVKPRKGYIKEKIIDYATCVYYILCAEDGETILFWSKYWGVFPLEAPSSGFSYSAENIGGVKNPELKIEYQYSWKEDFNPLSLIEFNMHSSAKNKKTYLKSYWQETGGESTKLHFMPYTWAGAPFIETVNQINPTSTDGRIIPYTFKLRFGKR